MPALLNRAVLLTALITLVIINANAQSISWAQTISGSHNISGTRVLTGTTDTAGNLYSVGWFGGTANFGAYTLTAVSNLDMFIMKEDSSGNVNWAKQVKGMSSGVYGCFGQKVDVDRNGNVFITGSVRDSFDFDPGPAVYKINSFGGYHTFILKLDSSGNFIWVKDIGTQISSVYISATTAKRDKNGYLYFAGQAGGNGLTPLDADPGPGVYNITPNVGELFLEKLDSDGNFIWVKLITGVASTTPTSLDFDSASNVFITGRFQGTADFDPGPGVYTLTYTHGTSSLNDIFVAKYDSAGNFGWAKCIGNTSDDVGNGCAVDRFGNVLVTGSFGGTVDFDPGPGVYNVTAASARSLFTLRLRNNGDFSWVKTGGASGTYAGVSVTSDSAGNVYTAMAVNGTCDLDPDTGVFNVSSGAAIQKLDSSGKFVWGLHYYADGPNWIGLDNKENVYMCGFVTVSSVLSGFIVKLNQILQPMGVNNASLQTDVSVYPNPSSGIVTFSSPLAIHRIELTDMAGKVVYINEPAKAKTVIDLGGKAAGVYFYEVDCGVGKERGKLVIY